MSAPLAAIVGSAAGAVALVIIAVFIVWFCLFRSRSVSRTSETGSSDPSIQVGRNVGIELQLREARRFEMEELSSATKNFDDKNLIGEGKFGEVYKGLLQDGMLVAIKKRPGSASQEFVNEGQLKVILCKISERLWLFHGLAHLHSLSPRVIHKDFKTANVLVDENFIAKVADAGLRNFLGRIDVAGPSSQVLTDEIFLAPEVKEFRRFSEKSDVYSFGVFLLELVSGREASDSPSSDTSQNLVDFVQNIRDNSNISDIIDPRLSNSFTTEGMEGFIRVIVRCLDMSSEKRPMMSYVVTELDRILEKEMNLTTLMGEGTPTVTLGSQLFRSTK